MYSVNQMNLNNSLGLKDLLKVEDDIAILNYKCSETGLYLWPQVRTVFLRMILSDLLYGSALVGVSNGNIPSRKAVQYLARSLSHNTWMRATDKFQADVCIMAEGIGNQLVDDVWFNRLSDYFVSACPSRSLVVEDHHNWNWAWPRHADRVLFHAPLQTYNAISTRLLTRKQHVQQAEGLVNLVCRRAKEHLGWEAGSCRQQQLTLMLARKTAVLPHQYRRYITMLKHIAPKVLMINAACYGPSSALIVAAKEMGIVTAEYQHGAVSSGHDGYNIACCLRMDSDYRATLPDYFLSYGTWWGEQINLPVTKLSIGNPHRDAKLSKLPRQNINKNVVLLLGDGIETEKYLDLSRQVAKGLVGKGLRVLFRPHPMERTQAEAFHKQGADGVELDIQPDIYQSLAVAHVVVSELSTGLFEAIGLTDNIFMWNSLKAQFCFPDHPFNSFSSADELIEILKHDKIANESVQNPDIYWEPNWQNNFIVFLKSIGIEVDSVS